MAAGRKPKQRNNKKNKKQQQQQQKVDSPAAAASAPVSIPPIAHKKNDNANTDDKQKDLHGGDSTISTGNISNNNNNNNSNTTTNNSKTGGMPKNSAKGSVDDNGNHDADKTKENNNNKMAKEDKKMKKKKQSKKGGDGIVEEEMVQFGDDLVKACMYCKVVETDGAKHMQCSRCKVTFYCSKECQTSDWKRHKKECKALKLNKEVFEVANAPLPYNQQSEVAWSMLDLTYRPGGDGFPREVFTGIISHHSYPGQPFKLHDFNFEVSFDATPDNIPCHRMSTEEYALEYMAYGIRGMSSLSTLESFVEVPLIDLRQNDMVPSGFRPEELGVQFDARYPFWGKFWKGQRGPGRAKPPMIRTGDAVLLISPPVVPDRSPAEALWVTVECVTTVGILVGMLNQDLQMRPCKRLSLIKFHMYNVVIVKHGKNWA
mmetsp:Transcript_30835/g.74554  ORF Transcript_30835/g.74554 Transcript_30835/m.74554 type:complete len:430 (-) Transcript_30835:211-1500(-)